MNMTGMLHPLTPPQVRERLNAGRAILVDIREADEFARSHIIGAQSQPLSTWEKAHLSVDPDADVIFTCRSGMRTAGACDRLAARVSGDAFVLEGGLDAWAKAGLPVATNADAPMEIMRQVQIAAG
jgi:rhodanese-related sulfurtransferase